MPELNLSIQYTARLAWKVKFWAFWASFLMSAFYVLLWLLNDWAAMFHKEQISGSDTKSYLYIAIIFAFGFCVINFPFLYLTEHTIPKSIGISSKSIFLWFVSIIPLLNIFIEQHNKYQELKDVDAPFSEKVMKMMVKAKIKIPVVVDVNKPSGPIFAGQKSFGRFSKIIVNDAFIKELTNDDLKLAILAHEMAHHINCDFFKGIGVYCLQILCGIILVFIIFFTVLFKGFASDSIAPWIPLLLGVILLYCKISILIKNYFSQLRENCADEYAVSLIGNGNDLADAFVEIGNKCYVYATPDNFENIILSDHPVLQSRITKARTWSSVMEKHENCLTHN